MFYRFCHQLGRRESSGRATTAKICVVSMRVFLEGSNNLHKTHILENRFDPIRLSMYWGTDSIKFDSIMNLCLKSDSILVHP